MMSTHTLNLLVMPETHIRPNDNDSLLHSFTPVEFKLCHKPHTYSFGRRVGFFVNQIIQFKIVYIPTYTSFENINTAIGSSARPFVITCVYGPPGSCSVAFFDQFFSISMITNP